MISRSVKASSAIKKVVWKSGKTITMGLAAKRAIGLIKALIMELNQLQNYINNGADQIPELTGNPSSLIPELKGFMIGWVLELAVILN
jgi:hypothetical protein